MSSSLKKSSSQDTLRGASTPDIAKADIYDEGVVDPVYAAKSHVLNRALQEIGMGKYQWGLFAVAGFGWFSDSVWPLLTSLILSPVLLEFEFNGPFLSLASNIGLLVGAILWSFGCDIWGRKWSFNLTLFMASIFGIASGGSPNFVALAALVAVLGVGVGGNMPVDSAVFLDFVPASHQYLLTVLSIWWAIGQLVGSLVAWPLIANFSCPTDATPETCSRSQNMGWRYTVFTLGGLMLILSFVRLFAFKLFESPRYLLGHGRDAEAVAVVRQIAEYNGLGSGDTESNRGRISVEELNEAAKAVEDKMERQGKGGEVGEWRRWRVLSEESSWKMAHVRNLFGTRKMAWSTSLLIALWGIIGLASTLYNSFLPYLLASRGAQFDDATYYTTYRNQVILSITGIPGAFLAGWAVELPWFGRRGTLAISAGEYSSLLPSHHFTFLGPFLSYPLPSNVFLVLPSFTFLPFKFLLTLFLAAPAVLLHIPRLTGAFLFASTTARSSNALLGWNCGYAFNSNIMYGVLYAISPELFPAKDRGTGNGLVSTATRVFGVIAPIIALYANINTPVPVYIAGALIIAAGGMALLLPFEPRGRASI
ncbi:MFS general substrate transporter [Stereum hirsutum FP-91666 SS1]|uniref:MFS general substrate transporter n=1 Tax=Stereum hirsutum (strain FP-91666) TaxID=721885 RepID=UPI0004449C56|nr:MFS general substrate transporter [Stereum hirsutum FP-91666 SS1]EIM84320.1 MFS general substrate transporter [Stereum hirsutum FP-91666 SS1]